MQDLIDYLSTATEGKLADDARMRRGSCEKSDVGLNIAQCRLAEQPESCSRGRTPLQTYPALLPLSQIHIAVARISQWSRSTMVNNIGWCGRMALTAASGLPSRRICSLDFSRHHASIHALTICIAKLRRRDASVIPSFGPTLITYTS